VGGWVAFEISTGALVKSFQPLQKSGDHSTFRFLDETLVTF
jgi:hypothetical protein